MKKPEALAALVLCALACTSCDKDPTIVGAPSAVSALLPSQLLPAAQATTVNPDASQYVLSFNEEFNDGPGIDAGTWSTDIWYKKNNPTRNFNVRGGTLNIWPALDASGEFFERTIVNEKKFAQQYGFFEVEAKLPVGAGLHPVISLVSTNGPEIGIMHAYTGAPEGDWSTAGFGAQDYVVTALSGPDTFIDEFRVRKYRALPDLSAGFHKYGVRWDADTVRYFFDGVPVGRAITHNSIRTPMYFYIGLWLAREETRPTPGSGKPGKTNVYTPQGEGNAFKINYVRAWRFKE